ncbi:MAG: hypothetical protein Q8O89_06440 [Nanoarchaeota archaeon]|nr:hypothetical protein [Nanoarchaeota archaeon]
MKQKTIILYDLKGKTQSEKVQTIRKLYGYRDKSNYNYEYERTGELTNIKFNKSEKTVIVLKHEKDLAKVVEILQKAKINIEIGKTQ